MKNKEHIYLSYFYNLVNNFAFDNSENFVEMISDLKVINATRKNKWLQINRLLQKVKLSNDEKQNIVNKNIKSDLVKLLMNELIKRNDFKMAKYLVDTFLDSIVEVNIKVNDNINIQNNSIRELILKYILKNISKSRSLEVKDIAYYVIQISSNSNKLEFQYIFNSVTMMQILNQESLYFDSLDKKELINSLFCYLINQKVKES